MKSNKEVLFTFGKHLITANGDLTGVHIDNSEEQLLLEFLYELSTYLETDPHLKNNLTSNVYYENYIKENDLSKKKPLAVISEYEISQHPIDGYMFIRNRHAGKIMGRGQVSISIDLVYAIVDGYPQGISTEQ